MASLTGWNRGTWNEGTWNSPVPLAITGVSAASQIGTAVASIPKTVSVTGVSAASAIGSVTVTFPVTVSVTGVSAASAIGSTQINFSFTVTGVSAEGKANNALVWSAIDESQTPNWVKIAA